MQRVQVYRTRQSFGSITEWVELYQSRLRNGRYSRHEYERRDRIFYALHPDMVWRSPNLDELELLEEFLRDQGNRFDNWPGWEKHHNELLIAAHNRAHQIRTGSAFRIRRRHGSGDPAQMPEHALDRVIQRGKDMSFIEQCRQEKAKRMNQIAAGAA